MRTLPLAPRTTPADAAEPARAAFSVVGRVASLAGTTSATSASTRRAASMCSRSSTRGYADAELELQSAALRHVAARLPGTVSEPIPARSGGDVAPVEHAGARLRVRLLLAPSRQAACSSGRSSSAYETERRCSAPS
jgi:Ser/Thr protein kinase RdoA (MazF antagonist)